MSFFSKNIRFMREKLNIKQDTFEQIGIKKGTYSNYENGKTEPNIEMLIKISNFLGLSLNDLICIDLSMQEDTDSIKDAKTQKKNGHPNGHLNSHLSPNSPDNPQYPTMAEEPSVQRENTLNLSIYKRSETEETQPPRDTGANELVKHLIEQLNEKSEEIGALKQENASLKNQLAERAEDAQDAERAHA